MSAGAEQNPEREEEAALERIERDPVGAGNAWVKASEGQMGDEPFEIALDEALGVDPQAAYRVATNDYMLKGGDGYAAFPRSKVIVDASGAVLLATIVMNYVEAKKTVAPAVDGRIVAK